MKKFLNILSALMFSIALLGSVALGIYIFFIKDTAQKTTVATPSERQTQDEAEPAVVVEDALKEEPKKQKDRSLEKYAYKKPQSELSWIDILYYIFLALLGFFVLKKLKQWWGYIVKNSA